MSVTWTARTWIFSKQQNNVIIIIRVVYLFLFEMLH